MATIPVQFTTQFPLFDTLQFVQARRCRSGEPQWDNLPWNLRSRHLVFSADQHWGNEPDSDYEVHGFGSGNDYYEFDDIDGENTAPPLTNTAFKALWYLVTASSGVEKVTIWTKQGEGKTKTLLYVQYRIIAKRMKEEESRENGQTRTGRVPFEVGRVDRETKFLTVHFAESKGTRNVMFNLA